MSTTTNLSTLKINYLTQAQYDTALENNEIDEDQIYFTPDPGTVINLYKDFNSPSFTTTTGAAGSYMMLMDVDVALSGYVPVSVTLCGWAHVSYIPILIIQNSTTVRIILLRNGSGAATYAAGDFGFRVGYVKE